MQMLKECPHTIFEPERLTIDCREEEAEKTIASMMKGERPIELKDEDKGPIDGQ